MARSYPTGVVKFNDEPINKLQGGVVEDVPADGGEGGDQVL